MYFQYKFVKQGGFLGNQIKDCRDKGKLYTLDRLNNYKKVALQDIKSKY